MKKTRKDEKLVYDNPNKIFGKIQSAYGGCLGTVRRRRTRLPAKFYGEVEVTFDP